MAKVRFVPYVDDPVGEISEVYGVKTYEQRYSEGDNICVKSVTELLLYTRCGWEWVDFKDCEPVE